jgi:hypothetical protein
MADLIVCIYGCHTIDKYKEQIRKINTTWENQCKHNVQLLFFLGGEPSSEFSGPQYIYNSMIQNDYISASYKQYYGLQHVYENYRTKFVLCCGTDTFINIPKLMRLLDKINPNESLYIGGHGDKRQIGDKTIEFHSGGPGFILTWPCLEQLYPRLPTIMDEWITMCKQYDVTYLLTASDVGIAYFVQEIARRISIAGFYHCNYIGRPCHRGKVLQRDIISCHSMSLTDFDEFYRILKINRFFIE